MALILRLSAPLIHLRSILLVSQGWGQIAISHDVSAFKAVLLDRDDDLSLRCVLPNLRLRRTWRTGFDLIQTQIANLAAGPGGPLADEDGPASSFLETLPSEGG